MTRKPKSRFGSVAGKKIEKEVRKGALMWLLNANNRKGHGIANEAGDSRDNLASRRARQNPINNSNTRHTNTIAMNENLASSARNGSKTNIRGHGIANKVEDRRDNLASGQARQNPIKNSNMRHTHTIATNENLTSSGRNGSKTNRRGHGVANKADDRRDKLASRQSRQNPIKNSNIRHTNIIVKNENLASSAWNGSKTNRSDIVATNDADQQDNNASGLAKQNPTKDSNTGHKITSMMNLNLAPLPRNASKNNRRDNGIEYETDQQGHLASRPLRHNPIKDRNIGHVNTSMMHASLAISSRKPVKNYREGKGVAIEADQRDNHASRPIKQDPPVKDSKTKHTNTTMVNGNLAPITKICSNSNQCLAPVSKQTRQPTTPSLKKCLPASKNINGISLQEKEIPSHSTSRDGSHPTHMKAMSGLVHKTMNVDGLDQYGDVLPSRLQGQPNIGKGENIIVRKDNTKKLAVKGVVRLENLDSKPMKKQRRCKEAKRDENADGGNSNPMGVEEINEDAYYDDKNPVGVKDYNKRNQTFRPMKRQKRCIEAIDDKVVGGGDLNPIGIEDDKTNCSLLKGRKESLPKEDYVTCDGSEEAVQPEKLKCRTMKKWRQYIPTNEDDVEFNGGDHSSLGVKDGTFRLTSQAAIPTDCLGKVPAPFAPQCVKPQCNYCSKPIDEPIWSGIFRIDGKDYKSLAGHLSTKSGEKVWKLSSSLMPVVEVTKLSRSEARPKMWETSKPSCNSIGLYFFPHEMRHDEDLDKLVKEVMENDLVLQTLIGEAELLIFPSTLLPERYKTFRRKHYLWGVFKPREDKCAVVAEPVNDTTCRAQEEEREEQHTLNQQDEVQCEYSKKEMSLMKSSMPLENQRFLDLHLSVAKQGVETSVSGGMDQQVYCKSPAESIQQVAAARGVPEERPQGNASHHTVHSAEASAVATNAAAAITEAAALATNTATMPVEATAIDTNAANIPANHGQTDSCMGISPDRIFCFVAGQTPRLEQLI